MRATNNPASRQRRKKILTLAKGYTQARRQRYRIARETVERALVFAYRDRRARKGVFRRLWISRINAATTLQGLGYSRLIHALQKANITINRKMLADLAVTQPETFNQIISIAKQHA